MQIYANLCYHQVPRHTLYNFGIHHGQLLCCYHVYSRVNSMYGQNVHIWHKMAAKMAAAMCKTPAGDNRTMNKHGVKPPRPKVAVTP